MKFLATIFSIYILVLNALPCDDIGNSQDDTLIISVVDADGSHDADCDLCSPFCQCHCCHTHAIGNLFLFTELEPQLINDGVLSKEDGFVLDVSFRFFQPPKNVG